MKITNLEEDEKELKFTLKESNPATANAIRRTTMREIPTLAVTQVDFFKNTSSMFDEYIAHRIGMTPITTPIEYEDQEDKSTIIPLTTKGPGTVHASELEPEDPEVEIIYPETPIIKLEENEEVELEGKAEIGRGKEHARHKPCYTTYTTETDKEAEKDEEETFYFTIESYTEKKPKEILQKSLKIIQSKAEEFKDKIKEVE